MEKLLPLMIMILFISCDLFNQSGNLEKAKKAELVGNYDEALKIFTEALLKIAPSAEVPDAYRSKFADPLLWKKEIEKYMICLHTPAEQINKDFKLFLEGAERCASKVHTENSLIKIITKAYSADQFSADWRGVFFDPIVQVDGSFASISDKSYNDNFSIFTITAPKNYNYEISLINRSTGKKISFNLFHESSRSILVVPGDYLFICRSTITFQTNQVWYSKYSIIPLNFPQQASKITAQLRTSVAKER